jgi:hypothetical protein
MKIKKCKMKIAAQINIHGRKKKKKDRGEIIMTMKGRSTQKYHIGHI